MSRYERMARELMSAPDPVRAIASVIGDHEGRLDVLVGRLNHVEAVLEAALGAKQGR